MGFKLGSETKNYAVGGEIRKKMRFGKEAGSEGFPWEREANNGNEHGSI